MSVILGGDDYFIQVFRDGFEFLNGLYKMIEKDRTLLISFYQGRKASQLVCNHKTASYTGYIMKNGSQIENVDQVSLALTWHTLDSISKMMPAVHVVHCPTFKDDPDLFTMGRVPMDYVRLEFLN